MEIEIGLLTFVLILMQTLLVVIFVHILPLVARFDSEKFEELLDLDLVVSAAEGLPSAEEPIFHLFRFKHVCSWPWVIVDLFLVVVAVVFLTTLFFLILITILIIIAAFLAVELLFFILLGVGVQIFDHAIKGLRCGEPGLIFNLFNRGQRIDLRVRLGIQSRKPV